MRKTLALLLGSILVSGLLLAGCQAQTSGSEEALRLKVGLLPIVDALPMYVAEAEGYFKDQNVEVELTLFGSALERDSALVAGQIDGELNDLISAALINKDAEKAKVVRLAYRGNPAQAMMLVLAAPGTKIQSPKDLKGVPIAISKNSVIEFATDKLLQSAGLSESERVKTEVTKMPVRAEMLAKGQVQAATLPEPLASLAVQQGARVIIDDSQSGIGQSVLTFRQEVVDKNQEAIKRFLVAYEKAVDTLNESPNKYRDLMVDKAKVPDSLRDSFAVPPFPKAQVSTKDDVDVAMEWMVKNGLLQQPIPFEKMVNDRLLPK